MRIAISVDTEADAQWSHGGPLTTRNVAFWEPFQEVCERYGAAPTYLITTEIAEDERAVALLTAWQRRGAAEVGAHLHTWSTPPFFDRPGLRHNDAIHAFASQLPDDLLREKIVTLTRQITETCGIRPTSHRSGRFGFDHRAADLLAAEGYVVDSSVTPYWSWSRWHGLDGRGGPDFSHHDPRPFRIRQAHDPRLIEVPVTVLPTYATLRRRAALLRAYNVAPVRAIRRFLLAHWLRPQPLWLTPDPRYSPDDLLSVWHTAALLDLPCAVYMVHSSELMPGGSPFRPDADSVRGLLDDLDTWLAAIMREGARPVTLTELARELAEMGPMEDRSL